MTIFFCPLFPGLSDIRCDQQGAPFPSTRTTATLLHGQGSRREISTAQGGTDGSDQHQHWTVDEYVLIPFLFPKRNTLCKILVTAIIFRRKIAFSGLLAHFLYFYFWIISAHNVFNWCISRNLPDCFPQPFYHSYVPTQTKLLISKMLSPTSQTLLYSKKSFLSLL